MSETSTPQSKGPPTKLELYREMHQIADRYFNGPYVHPDTRENLGRKLRDIILTIDRREALE
jgi:hypothetical protein